MIKILFCVSLQRFFQKFPTFMSFFSQFIMISHLQHFIQIGIIRASIPRNRVPECISHPNEGHEVYITPSPNLNSNNFLGFAFCVVISNKDVDFENGIFLGCSSHYYSLNGVSHRVFTSLPFLNGIMKSDHFLLGYLSCLAPKEWHGINTSFTASEGILKSPLKDVAFA